MATVTVVKPGMQTTIQDGGRPGYLNKGIPPAGAQDVFSLGMANLLVGNKLPPPPLSLGDPGDAGLEMLLRGPSLRFEEDAIVAVTGAEADVLVDGKLAEPWTAIEVPGGSVLECAQFAPGMRGYLAVAGGLDVPRVLGSRSTFVRGAQGGLHGRALRAGDRIPLGEADGSAAGRVGRTVRDEMRPTLGSPSSLRVVRGPQDEMFTDEAIELFFTAEWKLSPTSDRMGFRFAGPPLRLNPRPDYLVKDAGSGPADIVDDVIPVGGIQIAGGIEPIVMGVENPSVGGYAKIGTVISADFRVLGQVRPGESVRFREVDLEEAVRVGREQTELLADSALT